MRSKHSLGFSLIEVAVVLVILTVLLVGISVPIATQVESRRLEDSRRQLEEAKLSIMGFVSTFGRFPCPASSTSNGRESFCTTDTGACTATTALQTHGKCSNFYDGFLPAASLGMTPLDSGGYLRDPWGSEQNRVRYAVRELTIPAAAPDPEVRFVFTGLDTSPSQSRIKTATVARIIGTGAAPRDLLSVCKSGSTVTGFDCNGAPNTLTTQAPAVVFSLGKNAASTGGASVHEAKNVDNNQVFISRDIESGAGEFDDILNWISVYTVFNRMIEIGKLP